MTTNYLAYSITKELLKTDSIPEIAGPKDNPTIELMHQLTNIEDGTPKDSTDEIPWCSSGMNLVVLLAALLQRPFFVLNDVLLKRKYSSTVIRNLYKFFVERILPMPLSQGQRNESLNGAIMLPTYNAGAISWAKWGFEVPLKDARRGDIVVSSRVGGNHVSFLEDETLDLTKKTWLSLGYNQSNKLCISARDTSSIKTVRRA